MLEPGLAQIIREAIGSRLLEVHTAIPARCLSYDATTQRGDFEVVVKRLKHVADELAVEWETLPVIPNVPVHWPSAGGFSLHFPMVNGDEVELVFNEQGTGEYELSGQVSEPQDTTRHGMTYPFAVPGALALSKALLGVSSVNGTLIVGPAGALEIRTAVGEAFAVALAPLVQTALDSIRSVFNAHTHVITGNVSGGGPAIVATAAAPASPISALGPVAAEKLKAE